MNMKPEGRVVSVVKEASGVSASMGSEAGGVEGDVVVGGAGYP